MHKYITQQVEAFKKPLYQIDQTRNYHYACISYDMRLCVLGSILSASPESWIEAMSDFIPAFLSHLQLPTNNPGFLLNEICTHLNLDPLTNMQADLTPVYIFITHRAMITVKTIYTHLINP